MQEENFTKAAKQLHVTQPTLSRQIAQLEEELGGKLFQRSSHNILLTEDGMMLKRRVQEILTLADRTKQDFLRKKANLEGNHRHQQLWWYQAPYIVETFLESGGFSGKTAQILSKICPDATEAIVRHVLSLGINFFDTANGYSADTLRSKTDRIEMRDMEIVRRVQELAEGHGSKMQQIALVWHWAKGVASPIVGGTKASHYAAAAGALDVTLTPEEVACLEEPYLPHRVVGAVDHNLPEGVMLLDEKK